MVGRLVPGIWLVVVVAVVIVVVVVVNWTTALTVIDKQRLDCVHPNKNQQSR